MRLTRKIVGMSATMKNVEILARWINGHFYDCDFRPIPLCEFLVSEVIPNLLSLIVECCNVSRKTAYTTTFRHSASKNNGFFIKFNNNAHSRNSSRRTFRTSVLCKSFHDS